jgi:hypothetical protein
MKRTEFLRDGFWIDRSAFDAAELARYRAAARRVQAKTRQHLYPGTRFWFGNSQNRDRIPAEQRAGATWSVNEITRPELFEPELVNVFAHPRVDGVVRALLGDEPRAWGIKLLWTPKLVAYDLPWHRDQMEPEFYDWIQYKPAAPDHVQFNAALHDDDCFLVIPGSHRRALTAAEWHAVRHDKRAELPGQVRVTLQPGDILYMDAHTLHRGRSAVTGDRLTLHYSAQASWVPLKPWAGPAEFAWLTAEEFLAALEPVARGYYERLRTAERTDDVLAFARAGARAQGWEAQEQ